MRRNKTVSIILSAAMLLASCAGYAQIQTEVPQEITSTEESESNVSESVEITDGSAEESPAPDVSENENENGNETVELPKEETVEPAEADNTEETAEPSPSAEIALQPIAEQKTVLGASASPEIVSVGNYDISDTLTRYDAFDYSDPNYITDEVLFGEWDAATESWIPQDNPMNFRYSFPGAPAQLDKPLIDYSQNDELRKVEEAVKECNGNYNKPKGLLLKYYRDKFNGINKSVAKADDKVTTVRSNALAYNFVTENLTAIDMFDMDAEEKIYEFDVTSQISGVIDSTVVSSFVFVINALEIDQKQAWFASREADENRPYVIASLTDGSTRTFYPEADVTIKGGSNTGRNFPSEKLLYASERHNASAANDNYSQRAILKFDFSDIPAGTRIKSAKFGICGGTDKTDAPKKMFLASTSSVTWSETSLTWNSANFARTMSCDTLPGLEPNLYGNNGFYTFVHNVSVLASRYLYDSEEIYAYHALRLAVRYHQIFHKGPLRYNDFLDKGVNGFNMMDSFYSLINSEYMTPQVFGAMLKSAYVQTEWIQEGWNTNSAALNSNHATYYNKGFADLAIMLTEFYKANDPIIDTDPSYSGLYFGGRGGWIPCLQRRVMFKAKEISFPDGAGKEVPGGYNMEAYANTEAVLQYLLETDNLELLPDEYYDLMSTAALYFMHGMAPGYHDWNIGNSYGYGSQFINRQCIKEIIDALKILLDDAQDKTSEQYQERERKYNELLYAYTDGTQGKAPEFDSILYPFARKVVMRSSWDADAVGATMGISAGGIHAHFDDLSIAVAAYGRYLLADPGTEAYVQDNPYRAWVNSTRGHNTIEINDISQRSGFWSNSEMVKGPNGEKIVLPFRPNDNDMSLSGSWIADVIQEPENAEVKSIVDNKEYTQENLKKIYALDQKVATEHAVGKNLYFQGRFLENEMNSVFDYVKGETYGNIDVWYKDDNGYFGPRGKIYYGVDNAHNRSMLYIKPGFIIVTDYVAPINGNTQVNKYSQAWHFTNDANITMDERTKTVRTNFDDANLAVVPVMSNETEMTASILDGWYHTGTTVPAKYAAYVKNEAQATTFNTMLVTMAPGTNYETTTTPVTLDVKEANASAFKFQMTETNTNQTTYGTYYNVHNNAIKAERKVDDYTTDGRMMYVDKGEKRYQTAILTDGTFVQDSAGNYLIKSNDTVSHLGVAWQDMKLVLEASQDSEESEEYVDISRLTVYTEKPITSVIFNGKQIPFKQNGHYVYFGDEPIIDDGDTPTVTPTPVTPVKPSSPHGGGGNKGGSSAVVTPPVEPSDSEEQTDSVNPNFRAETQGHWGEKEIRDMIDKGIVKGVDENTLGLNRNVTRAEFVTMLTRALGVQTTQYHGEFSDVSAGEWYADTLSAAKAAGILGGDENGNANPNAVITREEMAKMAVSAMNSVKGITAPEGRTDTFADENTISDWAKEYIQAAASLGLMKGMEDGTFAPHSSVLREQAIVMMYRMYYFK